MSPNPSESDADPTLYDPPAEHAETSRPEEDGNPLALEIPKELANQLLEVAQHLGLNPEIVASRAVGLICDEVGLVDNEGLTSGALIQKYQSRLDLLHNIEYDIQEEVARAEEEFGERSNEEFGWDAVDQIIEEGARSAPDGRAPSLAKGDPGEEAADEEYEETFTPELPTAELDQDEIPTDEDDDPSG